ncbi:MAG TPA: enolase C-terminal domain-like protein [Xanthobacteraceae bacterium]|jgi:mandelate racemase
MSASPLVVRGLQATCVEVPMTYALGTSRGRITAAPLLLLDLQTEQGITGHAYIFCYVRAAGPAIAKVLGHVETLVKGDLVVPLELSSKLAMRFALMGVQGIVRMAAAALDVATWDALAVAAGLPLARLLGAQPTPIPAYNSCGLGLMDDLHELADEAEKLVGRGFRAIKLRLGYPTARRDLAALQAVRKRIGGDIAVMVDYNQALSVAEALERGRLLDAENVVWIEEPIRHDDYAGCARLARELKTPVQLGENFSGSPAMATALSLEACDFVMPDLERIGGVSGWQCAAALATVHGVEMSSHLFPEVSAHLLAATPTRHFLEYVDWADKIVQRPLRIVDGNAIVADQPGNGLVWDAAAVKHYRME